MSYPRDLLRGAFGGVDRLGAGAYLADPLHAVVALSEQQSTPGAVLKVAA